MWKDANRGGAIFSVQNFTVFVGGAWNDAASSFENKTGSTKAWWYDNNCAGGTTALLGPGGFSNPSWWANDETSSIGRPNCA